MDLVYGFVIMTIKLSGLIVSVYATCISLVLVKSGSANGFLAKQASGFLMLFLMASLIYLVI